MKNRLVAVLGFSMVCYVAWPALAKEVFIERVRKMYGLPRTLGSCQLCHHPDEAKDEVADQRNLNDYGKDIANLPLMKPLIEAEEDHEYTPRQWAKFEEAMHSIDVDDSDKDGATNLEELALGTFPGEKTSTPDAAALKTFRDKAKKIPSEQK